MLPEPGAPVLVGLPLRAGFAIVTESSYAMEWTMTGTHDRSSPLPATHKPFSIRDISIGEVQQGKIRRNTDYWNRIEFLGAKAAASTGRRRERIVGRGSRLPAIPRTSSGAARVNVHSALAGGLQAYASPARGTMAKRRATSASRSSVACGARRPISRNISSFPAGQHTNRMRPPVAVVNAC
ncbi:MAG: ester cyclase [Chloroflexi bacterium]|nr:ester cyclase [Chloroflexota bacterium]